MKTTVDTLRVLLGAPVFFVLLLIAIVLALAFVCIGYVIFGIEGVIGCMCKVAPACNQRLVTCAQTITQPLGDLLDKITDTITYRL